MKLLNTKAEMLWIPTVSKHLEFCGRICYNSLDRITEDSSVPFVEHKVKAGHWSVLEHAGIDVSEEMPELDKLKENSPEFGLVMSRAVLGGIRYSDLIKYSSKYDTFQKALDANFKRDETLLSFDITSSRYISQQFERHRNFSYAEKSLRYVAIDADNFSICLPTTIKDEAVLENLKKHVEDSVDLYKKIREAGNTKDDARSVLPMCTATRFVATGQLTWWIDFLTKRYDAAASKEMIKLCQYIFNELPESVQGYLKEKYNKQMEAADDWVRDE